MTQQSEEKTVEDNKLKKNFKTSDERYRTLFEQVNAAAFLTTLDGQILEANQKSCELLGYKWDEILRLSSTNLAICSQVKPSGIVSLTYKTSPFTKTLII